MDLSPSAYVTLGLLARYGPMTPYQLQARVEGSIGYFWPIPRAQLYRDPPRLAAAGLLTEQAEGRGRRRRVYRLTDAGADALRRWLADPGTPPPETRDPALLKLAFADLEPPEVAADLARSRAAQHLGWLRLYRERRAALDPADPAAAARSRLLSIGILHQETYAQFWAQLAADPEGTAVTEPGPRRAGSRPSRAGS